MLSKPDPGEHAAYYGTYVGKVPDGDVLAMLESEGQATQDLLAAVPAAREGHRYAEGKWNVREVVGHLIDTERLFALRALHFARADPAPLPGMDQEVWAASSNAGSRPLPELRRELAAVRAATLVLFRGFDDAALSRRGMASGCEFSVRALASIILGHELHHRAVLGERYGL